MRANDDALAAQRMLKDIYEDGVMELNGRQYKFSEMQHKKRRKVFAFFSKIGSSLNQSDLSFLDSEEFGPVEAVINDSVSLDGSLLSRLGDAHWQKHPDDYVPFICAALGVISYPFLPASDIG